MLESQIMLRDGRVIDITMEQQHKLACVILMAKDVDEQEVKVGGVKFKLKDMMTEQEKLEARQQQMELDDKQKKEEQQYG